MIFFAMIAVFAAVFATLAATSISALNAAKEYQRQSATYIANDVSTYVNMYSVIYGKTPTLTNGAYSTPLQELANTAGFEPLKAYIDKAKGGTAYKNRDIAAIVSTPVYSSSTALVNNTNTMQQAYVVIDYNFNTDLSKYTAATNNVTSTLRGCKSDGKDFSTSGEYCPISTPTEYFRVGNLANANFDVAVYRLKAIADRFEAVYKNSGTVPGTVGSTIALNASIDANPPGGNVTSAANCVGMFSYQKVPLSCGDLYFGATSPVSYTKLASNQIKLTVANFYYDKNKTLQPYSYIRTF